MLNSFKFLCCVGMAGLCAFPTMNASSSENLESYVFASSDKRIRGIVKDESGIAIIGASIRIKNTTNGTITDFNGNFELNVSDGDIFEVSYVGYVTQNIKIDAREEYQITLSEDAEVLDEVVVVGYGVQKKVNVVGSIASVDSKDLQDRPNPSVTQSIMGKMPGVTITQAGARPGVDNGTIRVRGVGSFGATPDALVLIDGMPGDLSSVNPADVVNISILKDASTAAIYGARAANGVVLVTTKEGKEGKISVSYNGYIGVNKPTELPQFVNSWEYAEILNEAGGVEVFSPDDIQKMKDGSDPDHWANEKYLEDVFSGNGLQTGHDISISGGGKRSQYFASFGYLNQNGVVPGNNYTRYNARLNLTSELTDKLKMTIRLQGDQSMVKEPETAGNLPEDGMETIIKLGVRFAGYNPTKLSDGSWGTGPTGAGAPMAWLESASFAEKPITRLRSSIKFDYKPISGLTISAIGAYNNVNKKDKRFHATLPVSLEGENKILGPSRLQEEWTTTSYKSFQATLNYNKSFAGKHNMDVLLGYSWEDESSRNLMAKRINYPSNDLPYISSGSPENQFNDGGGYEWAIQSVFGRIQYNFKERYLFESTIRYDGSSRFPNSEKYGLFPSAAVGWRLSEENFIKEREQLSFIDNLKLKASIGVLGNNNIGNYAYHSTYNLGDGFNYPFGGVINQGAGQKNYSDPNLKWETTRTFDVGFESLFWKGLLGLNVTYFYRYTYDVLYKPAASVSSIFGLNLNETNTGELSNKGWEFELSHHNKIGNFSYGINANFSIINNKIETLGVGNVLQPNGLTGNGSDLFIGYPMNIYYGYLTDGVFLDQNDIDAYFEHTDQSKMGSNKNNTKPGDIRYKDISGPEGIPDGKVDPVYDRVVLGSKIPKYTYGISLNAGYKGFDLNIFMQGVGGVKGMLTGYSGFALNQSCNVQRWQADGAFDPENPIRYPDYPRFTVIDGTGINNQISDFWVRDASYLRIKNIQLGYSLPKSILAKTFLSNVRFYVSLENPFIFDRYPEGWDAQTQTEGNGEYYPFMSNYTFGVNLKF